MSDVGAGEEWETPVGDEKGNGQGRQPTKVIVTGAESLRVRL